MRISSARPRWWMDPASRDTFLVYTNTATDNSQSRWDSGLTLIQKMAGGLPVGAPRTLFLDFGYEGKSGVT